MRQFWLRVCDIPSHHNRDALVWSLHTLNTDVVSPKTVNSHFTAVTCLCTLSRARREGLIHVTSHDPQTIRGQTYFTHPVHPVDQLGNRLRQARPQAGTSVLGSPTIMGRKRNGK